MNQYSTIIVTIIFLNLIFDSDIRDYTCLTQGAFNVALGRQVTSLLPSTRSRRLPPSLAVSPGIAAWQRAWHCRLELSASKHKVTQTSLGASGGPPSVCVFVYDRDCMVL